jgi:carbonic anhydrase
LQKFQTLVGRNNRPIQPLNGRLVQAGYAQAVQRSQPA